MFDFLSKKFSSVFSSITGKSTLSEGNIQESLDKVRDALLEADVPFELVNTFIDDIKKEVIGQKVLKSLKPGEQFIKVVHERLKAFLGGDTSGEFVFPLPSVTMVMGLQGSGKTTTVAKMAYRAIKQAQAKGKKRRILLASVDFYRPAAVDQLEVLSKQVGVDFYRTQATDPVAASREIYDHFKREGYQLLFLDTAGRLHVESQLLQELRDIDAYVRPKQKFLVLDSMTGQESLSVAQAFEQGVGYHAAILTKMDSDTRGGAAFSFRYAQKKPIRFVGFGEKIADLQAFHPDRMAGTILGMGDMLSLIEKADQEIKQEEQQAMQDAFMKGRMTLQDFANQMSMVSKIGSLGSIAKYMPGMGGMSLTPEMIEKGEKELKSFKAIIGSMTPKERLNHRILDGSRKQRIARGAGVAVVQVNLLLDRFEQSQQYAKLFKRFGRFNKFFKP